MQTSEEDKSSAFGHTVAGDYYRTTAGRSHRRTEEWYRHASEQKLLRLRRWLPADRKAKILEIGCGCGELIYGLEHSGYTEVTGVDLCKDELDEARNFVKSDLICSDISSYLDAADGKHELVIAYNVLEHFQKHVLIELLRKIRGVLKHGGALVVMVPNAVSPIGGTTRYWDISHELAFTTNSWHQLAALAGFDHRPEVRECGPVVHGPMSLMRFLLWRCIRLAIRFYLACEVVSDRGGIYTQDMMVCLKNPVKDRFH